MTDRLKDDEKLALALYFQDTPEGEAAMELLRSRLTAEREARVKAEQELAAARERERWIPVSEREPDPEVLVLVFNPDWGFSKPILAHKEIEWCGHYGCCPDGAGMPELPTFEPTHWRPLPSPPEEL